MKPVNSKSQAVLDKLTAELQEPGDAKKIDNTEGVFMPVCVELVQVIKSGDFAGPIFSVAHYGEQNGDLMRDPEMLFLRGVDDRYYPINWRNDYVGKDEDSVAWLEGKIIDLYPELQRKHAIFANLWMPNIRSQQRLRA